MTLTELLSSGDIFAQSNYRGPVDTSSAWRERETDRQTETGRQTDRQTDRDRGSEGERQRETEAQRERGG